MKRPNIVKFRHAVHSSVSDTKNKRTIQKGRCYNRSRGTVGGRRWDQVYVRASRGCAATEHTVADTNLQTRPLEPRDYARIVEIYNHYIEHSPCTFDVVPFTIGQRVPWFAQFDEPMYQCVVANRGREVLGYACSQQFKVKPAYRTSVEVSVYAAPEATGSGVGTALYAALFQALAGSGAHRAYGGVTLPNDASVALHESFGFTQVAHYHEVGFKFDQFWDVVWLEKDLSTL